MPRLVADAIREEILQGRLRPLQRLSQDELAARFGVSRMPIREALRTLETEGLVHITPHRGAVVTDISVADIREVYSIRKMMEGHASELGAMRMQADELEQLRHFLRQLEQYAVDNIVTPTHVHRGFHFTIYDAASMPRLSNLINSLWSTSERYRRFFSSLPGRKAAALESHRRLLECCEQHDGAGARQATIDHLTFTEETVIQNLQGSIFS